MRKILLTAAITMIGSHALAASVLNKDSENHTLVVTESGKKSEIVVAAGETIDFCISGCFVTLPNGDREVLTGSETVEISDGRFNFK